MIQSITTEIRSSISVKQRMLEDVVLLQKIHDVGEKCKKSLEKGGQLIFAGNGGSAADAQHLAAEFVSKLAFDRKALSARALTTDPSIVTALSNDYGFDQLFRRQLEAFAGEHDIFIAITTSGKSENLNLAISYCIENNISCVCLTSTKASIHEKKNLQVLEVPSSNTARIQEAHILIGHIICKHVEDGMFL